MPARRITDFVLAAPRLAFRTARAGPVRWIDIIGATLRLASAHRRLHRLPLEDIATLSAGQPLPSRDGALSPEQRRRIDRIAWAIPRVGKSLPWRGDCLIQAIAAQGWLAEHGVPSRIVIGVRPEDGPATKVRPFDAHAWLTVEGETIIGGETSSFSAFG